MVGPMMTEKPHLGVPDANHQGQTSAEMVIVVSSQLA